MARPKIYENAAERRAAYLSEKFRADFLADPDLGKTLTEISEIHDVSRNALLNALVRFALTNHDWKREMLWGLTRNK